MSNIRFLCPACSAKLSVESGDAHLFIECPECRQKIRAWGAKLLDIKFSCPDCGKKMVIDASAAGCLVDCPGCSKTIRIPSDSLASRSPPPSPSSGGVVPPAGRTPAPSSLLTPEEVSFLAGAAD